MFRRDTGKFSRTLGIAYIIFQFTGGFLGGLIAFLFNNGNEINFGIDDRGKIGYSIISEVLGSFFLAFLYLTQTEEKTKLSKDPAITTLIIAASYISALLMVSGPFNYLACLNPAVALGASMQQSYAGDSSGWEVCYVFFLMPFAGSIAAVIFFELIYKKVHETITESEEVDGILDGDNQED